VTSLRKLAAAACMGVLCCALPAAASAQSEPVQATLHASFSPDRLSVSTTIGFSFTVRTADGLAPSPLTGMDLHMPAGMNYTETTLGLAECSKSTLEAHGGSACPGNSRLGSGSAAVEVPFGTGAGHELPEITAFMGPPGREGNMVVLFYVDGVTPVYGQYVFTGEVLPATGLFGSQLSTVVPLVESVADGPDVSIVRASAAIGPNHLTYHRRVHGKWQSFHPRGIAVPERCPKGGFPFKAQFSFQDGAQAQASAVVPCPRGRRRAA
jgi:hypothetical protein